MNKEEKLLLCVLNAYLRGDSVELGTDIDYLKFYSLARSHNLCALVFSVVKGGDCSAVPEEILSDFENAFYDAVMRYTKQSEIIDEMSGILCENGIQHVFFKGAHIRDYFPVSEMRVMGDIDILIHPEDRDRVRALLGDNGYRITHSNGPVYNYEKNDCVIEMHSKIISGRVGSSNAEEGFLDAMEHAVFDGYRGTLEPEYHLAYLLAHIAHHFWFYGAGVKLILDLAVMQMALDISIDAVLDKMAEIGLDDFSRIILSVCSEWFGQGRKYTDDTAQTQRFLMSFGAFGNLNRSRAMVVTRKELEEGKGKSGLVTRARLLFPSYSKIKDIPYMKFMEGRPYLLPAGWIYRIFYNLKNRPDFVRDVNSNLDSDETKSEAQLELQYFKEIGLL